MISRTDPHDLEIPRNLNAKPPHGRQGPGWSVGGCRQRGEPSDDEEPELADTEVPDPFVS